VAQQEEFFPRGFFAKQQGVAKCVKGDLFVHKHVRPACERRMCFQEKDRMAANGTEIRRKWESV
jgi:hypothetical protein